MKYSTLAEYVSAVKAENKETYEKENKIKLEIKKVDDFFPYIDEYNLVWTGYFTSRPNFKRYFRHLTSFVNAASQLSTSKLIKRESPYKNDADWNFTQSILAARRVTDEQLAIMMHHDAITGTSKDYVMQYYFDRMQTGFNATQGVYEALMAEQYLSSHNWTYCNNSQCDWNLKLKSSAAALSIHNPSAITLETHEIEIPLEVA